MQDCSMVMAIPANMEMVGPLAGEMRRRHKPEERLFSQRKLVGRVVILDPSVTGIRDKYMLFMLTKTRGSDRTKTIDLARCILDLRRVVRSLKIERVAIPSIDYGLDGIPFNNIKALYEAVFRPTNVQLIVCTHYYTNLLRSLQETTNEECQPGSSGNAAS